MTLAEMSNLLRFMSNGLSLFGHDGPVRDLPSAGFSACRCLEIPPIRTLPDGSNGRDAFGPFFFAMPYRPHKGLEVSWLFQFFSFSALASGWCGDEPVSKAERKADVTRKPDAGPCRQPTHLAPAITASTTRDGSMRCSSRGLRACA